MAMPPKKSLAMGGTSSKSWPCSYQGLGSWYSTKSLPGNSRNLHSRSTFRIREPNQLLRAHTVGKNVKILRGRCTLRLGAVPRIFPNIPMHLSKPVSLICKRKSRNIEKPQILRVVCWQVVAMCLTLTWCSDVPWCSRSYWCPLWYRVVSIMVETWFSALQDLHLISNLVLPGAKLEITLCTWLATAIS